MAGTVTLNIRLNDADLKRIEAQIKHATGGKHVDIKLDKANRDLDVLGSKAKSATSEFGGMINTITKISIATAAIGGLTSAISSWTEKANIQMRAERLVEQTIKATGGAAGLTAEEVKKMASELQGVTTVGDEAILSGQGMLLTFKNIGKDIFPAVTEAMLDMSTAMNGGATPNAEQLKGTAIQLGKALNDPIEGLGALSRVGVQFSAEQEKLIHGFVKQGDLMGAQKIIIQELQSQFGGLSRSMVDLTDGGMKQLDNRIGDVEEKFGKLVNKIKGSLIPAFEVAISRFEDLGDAVESIGEGNFWDALTSLSVETTFLKAAKQREAAVKGYAAALKELKAVQTSEQVNEANLAGVRALGVEFAQLSRSDVKAIEEFRKKLKTFFETAKQSTVSSAPAVDNLKALREELKRLQEAHETIELGTKEFDESRAKIEALQERIKKLTQTAKDAAFSPGSLAALNNRLGDLKKKFDEAASPTQAMADEISELEGKIKTLRDSFDDMLPENVKARMEELGNAAKELVETLGENIEEIDILPDQEKFESEVNALVERFAGAVSKLGDVSKSFRDEIAKQVSQMTDEQRNQFEKALSQLEEFLNREGALLLAWSESVGSVIVDSMAGVEDGLKNAYKAMLVSFLDYLQRFALAKIVEATIGDLGTLGPLGLIKAAVTAGLIRGALSSLKSVVTGFEHGGVVIGERGPEIVAPAKDYTQFMGVIMAEVTRAINFAIGKVQDASRAQRAHTISGAFELNEVRFVINGSDLYALTARQHLRERKNLIGSIE